MWPFGATLPIDQDELHTDPTAVYISFGILLANAARSFETFGSGRAIGWRSSIQGYLGEQAMVTATWISSDPPVGSLPRRRPGSTPISGAY